MSDIFSPLNTIRFQECKQAAWQQFIKAWRLDVSVEAISRGLGTLVSLRWTYPVWAFLLTGTKWIFNSGRPCRYESLVSEIMHKQNKKNVCFVCLLRGHQCSRRPQMFFSRRLSPSAHVAVKVAPHLANSLNVTCEEMDWTFTSP